MHPRLRTIAALAVLSLAASACAPVAKQRRYQDENMDMGAIRTVAVLPLTNLTRDNLAADRVREVFANMLLATGALYVVPQGEVNKVVARVGLASQTTPAIEEVTRLGTALKADAVFTGVLKEYGELRSGTASGSVISISAQLVETGTGKIIWSASSTKGGVTIKDRLLGGGGEPMNVITEDACNDLLDQLFK